MLCKGYSLHCLVLNMVDKCCIPGIEFQSNYKSMKTNVPFTAITVFSFPKNDVLRKEWIRRIPRDLTITKTTVICVKTLLDLGNTRNCQAVIIWYQLQR